MQTICLIQPIQFVEELSPYTCLCHACFKSKQARSDRTDPSSP